ncbi:MAG: SGNH/GDSL hydrolase family protein [Acidobacteriota bacterium]|nr:SGNH/GDSL hydrolase family protein [Acidobacteriota bacterium]
MLKRFLLFVFVLSLGVGGLASAGTISTVVVYGDSLSDTGNLFKVSGQPAPPYYMGRASNGPLAVEDIAKTLGVPLLDYAFGGATTGIGNHLDPGGTATSIGKFGLPGITTLYAGSLATVTPLASTALFIVWGGPDDFLSPSPLDASPIATANRAVSNIVNIVNGLQGIGAQHILVPGMPDTGLTPFLMSQGAVAAAQATALTNYFDAQLTARLPGGATYFDTATLLRTIVANPAAYGFTNVTSQCFDATTGSVCGNPDQYLFFDDFHPTARASSILAANLTAVSVPEPSTSALMAASFLLLGLYSAVRRRASSKTC